LLAESFGAPLPVRSAQTEVARDAGSRCQVRRFATPRERELLALFGDEVLPHGQAGGGS
jgi:hypothetical protein